MDVTGKEIGYVSQLWNLKQVELAKPRYPTRVCETFLGTRNLGYMSDTWSDPFAEKRMKGCKSTCRCSREDDG